MSCLCRDLIHILAHVHIDRYSEWDVTGIPRRRGAAQAGWLTRRRGAFGSDSSDRLSHSRLRKGEEAELFDRGPVDGVHQRTGTRS